VSLWLEAGAAGGKVDMCAAPRHREVLADVKAAQIGAVFMVFLGPAIAGFVLFWTVHGCMTPWSACLAAGDGQSLLSPMPKSHTAASRKGTCAAADPQGAA
jgi:hypothetical protein